MRSLMKTAGLVAAVLVMGTAGSAQASTVEVKVPFAFLVHGQTLPAGTYRFEHNGAFLEIQGEHGNRTVMFVLTTPAPGRDPLGDKPALTFTRHEKQYRLTDVWNAGSQGWDISSQ